VKKLNKKLKKFVGKKCFKFGCGGKMKKFEGYKLKCSTCGIIASNEKELTKRINKWAKDMISHANSIKRWPPGPHRPKMKTFNFCYSN
jgi:hypothetical protein